MPSINLASKSDYYRSSLNGHHSIHRNRWLLVQSRILTRSELQLYDFYISVSVWDHKKVTYGYFEKNNQAIKQLLHLCPKTINKWTKILVEKGLIIQTDNPKYYMLTNPDRYFSSTRSQQAKEETGIEVSELVKKMSNKYESSSLQSEQNSGNSGHYQAKLNSKTLGSSNNKFDVNHPSFNQEDEDWIKQNLG